MFASNYLPLIFVGTEYFTIIFQERVVVKMCDPVRSQLSEIVNMYAAFIWPTESLECFKLWNDLLELARIFADIGVNFGARCTNGDVVL